VPLLNYLHFDLRTWTSYTKSCFSARMLNDGMLAYLVRVGMTYQSESLGVLTRSFECAFCAIHSRLSVSMRHHLGPKTLSAPPGLSS
jgi:hypothetical protein